MLQRVLRGKMAPTGAHPCPNCCLGAGRSGGRRLRTTRWPGAGRSFGHRAEVPQLAVDPPPTLKYLHATNISTFTETDKRFLHLSARTSALHAISVQRSTSANATRLPRKRTAITMFFIIPIPFFTTE